MKLAEIEIGQDYALAGVGKRRVTAVAVEKVPEKDKWSGRPTGRMMSQVLVRNHDDGREYHTKAQNIERTWAEQEEVEAKFRMQQERTARYRQAAKQIVGWLEGRDIKADNKRTFSTGIEIPGWELEKFAALLGIELDLEPEQQ